ncbi:unnamed protein product [Adineta steineri]|uniref:Uncharacterized protein n=1 Tax=Adineta steineri TaxID=433720 RepID=A0A815S9E8_9BILA|nr:unnamed protein product [Adineta steineri]CAF1487974.1 unnamed protein product [Adineta steineri]
MALTFLIEQAKQIADGQIFKTDLRKQIIEEIKRIYTRIIVNDVHTKIADNSEIDPDKIATNAYNDSIGSNPPDANNIMKYIIDINPIETVEKHDCHNTQQVYQKIVKKLQQILSDFRLSPIIGISTEMKDPDRFKESFKQLLLDRTNMYQEIVECNNIFDTAATESCINLIKTRLGCQSRCPGCGTKCDNTEINHTKHYSSHHLGDAFYNWRIQGTNKPYLYLCYQFWVTISLYTGEIRFHPRQKCFSERAPEWFDDLEQKSKTGNLCNDSKPPAEQRRAWMAVRHALIKRYSTDGMEDLEKYDEKFYPAIESVSADFEPESDYIQS